MCALGHAPDYTGGLAKEKRKLRGGAGMERALVIGASGGIGAALVATLAGRGDDVTGLSRSRDGLDVTDEGSIARLIGGLEGPFQTVIVATGALMIDGHRPEKTLKAVDAAGMAAQFALNAMGPMLVLKHALRLMPKDAPARFGVLSARVGSVGDNALGGWYSYRTAKAALNQLIHTAAIEVARSHPQAVLALLHPGTVDTAFTAAYQPAYEKLTPAQSAVALLGVLDGLIPAQSGGFFDYRGEGVPW
jgi:NAD(P)-dependent dehydrogenase (short-subunit alcohol dehydrogenase family)